MPTNSATSPEYNIPIFNCTRIIDNSNTNTALRTKDFCEPIQIGDVLTSPDFEVHILGYDFESDTFLCDFSNLDGKLIRHAMPIRATIIETCYRKRC